MKVCVIPARGGSKRIPRKNIKDFKGKPMIAWSIANALNSGCFDRVIVSTEDKEIADIAQRYGADTPFTRPEELADDYTTTTDVIKHTLTWFADHDQPIEYICCLYATAPLLDVEKIREGAKAVIEQGYSYAFPVTEFDFPIQRAVKRLEDGSIEMLSPKHINTRSQDLPPTYHDAGQFYWGRAEAFLSDVPFYSKKCYSIIIPGETVQDIDTPSDWLKAEALFNALNDQNAHECTNQS